MAQLRQAYQEFHKRQTEIVVIGPDGPADFETYFHEHNLPFTGLPDPTARVLSLYQQEVNALKLGRMPAQVIIDRDGLVRHLHYALAMLDIPSNASILRVIDNL